MREACPRWKWKWNLTEGTSHDETGSALQKKNCQQLQHGPLSARRELQSHPLAGQAQAQNADGPEGPMAPIVTTGGHIVKKKRDGDDEDDDAGWTSDFVFRAGRGGNSCVRAKFKVHGHR